MKPDEIKLVYDYNYWANGRILETCARVSQEQYVAITNYGCLRAAVVHILDAEYSWLYGFKHYFVPSETIKNSSPQEAKLWEGDTELTEVDLPTLDALNERWRAEERDMRAYLDSLTEQDMYGLVRYRVPEGFVRERILWHCLLHVVNHGTQHRSEAAAILTRYGQSPGELDFTVYLNNHWPRPI